MSAVDRGAAIYTPSPSSSAISSSGNSPFPSSGAAQTNVPSFPSNYSKRHLDMGVTTGCFTAKVLKGIYAASLEGRQLSLTDLNNTALNTTKRRKISCNADIGTHFAVGNAMGPFPEAWESENFDSISMFKSTALDASLCEAKAKALAVASEYLKRDSVLIGCSMLPKRWEKCADGFRAMPVQNVNRMAKGILRRGNMKGRFDNFVMI